MNEHGLRVGRASIALECVDCEGFHVVSTDPVTWTSDKAICQSLGELDCENYPAMIHPVDLDKFFGEYLRGAIPI